MTKISDRQQKILTFIRQEVERKGYPPSVREICEGVGLASSSTVHGHLDSLARKGYIRKDPTKPRAIEILTEGGGNPAAKPTVTKVPILGKVTAGLPITAIEHVESYFPLPTHMVREHTVFMLHVCGTSMIEVGICDGDMVIVRQQNTAENGEIVVAMTEDDEATVKTFYQEADHIRLQPENATLPALRYDHVTILGKVIGVFRTIS